MQFKSLFIASAAGFLIVGGAHAQSAQPSAAPAAQAQAQQFSDDEVRKFAAILTGIDKIRADHAASGAATPVDQDPQAKERMAAVVQQSGLPFETYNAIAARMSADDELNSRIAAYMPDKDAEAAN